jgi:ribosomal-protein-alanine N-acetyltransferase
MTTDDLDAVHELEKESFSSPWSRSAFEWHLTQNKTGYASVLVHSGRLLGYCLADQVLDECHITNIAVTSKHRKQGIATLLLAAVLQWAQQNGVHIVYLEVRRSNVAALSLYRKHRFQVIGVRENYYPREKEDALIMARSLDEEIPLVPPPLHSKTS